MRMPVRAELAALVQSVVAATPITDVHTHLYDPAFGPLLLSGIDDLLTYHYLVAEGLRSSTLPYETFWAWPKATQAEWIWQELFLDRSPVSEACRGVVTTLHALSLDIRARDLPALRRWFANWKVDAFADRCFELAGVQAVHMTNSPFKRRGVAAVGARLHARSPLSPGLRIDQLLLAWPRASQQLAQRGYRVGSALTSKTLGEMRRFLADAANRIDARYLMVSLPPDCLAPGKSVPARLLERAVLPHCDQLEPLEELVFAAEDCRH